MSTPSTFTVSSDILMAEGTPAATATPLVRLDQTTIYRVQAQNFNYGGFLLPTAEDGAQVGDVFHLYTVPQTYNMWTLYATPPDLLNGWDWAQYCNLAMGMIAVILVAPGQWQTMCM